MVRRLIDQYKHKSRIYLSWDAASWHISKTLRDYVAGHNEAIIKGENQGPTVASVPLPAGAQFLNVIESVFSGMARAILANSNYGSIDEARAAIDRYIRERNEKFAFAPKRAGGAIWGSEREPPQFLESNNCITVNCRRSASPEVTAAAGAVSAMGRCAACARRRLRPAACAGGRSRPRRC
jgi:hypothetical protein